MNWLDSRYKRWGVVLALGYLLMQAGVTYFYYYPPASAREITKALATALPWIGGVESIATLSIVGERLSFTMAVAYLPGVCLGVLAFARELIFKSASLPVRSKWQDALTCLYVIGVLCLIHYFGYWQKIYWRNYPQLIHTFIAAFIPFLVGFSSLGLTFRFKQLFINK